MSGAHLNINGGACKYKSVKITLPFGLIHSIHSSTSNFNAYASCVEHSAQNKIVAIQPSLIQNLPTQSKTNTQNQQKIQTLLQKKIKKNKTFY